MLRSTGARVSALLCAALAVSAFVPLPVPVRELRLAAGAGTAVLRAERLRLTWGLGRLRGENLSATLDGLPLVTGMQAAEVHVDTLPWKGRFLEARRLELRGGEAQLDRERLRLLTSGPAQQTVPHLPVRWRDGQLIWLGPELGVQPAHFPVRALDGMLDPARTRLHATLGGPFALEAEAWLEASGSFARWSAAVRARTGPWQRALAELPAQLELRSEGLELLALAGAGPGQAVDVRVQATVRGGAARLARPPLAVQGLEITATGSWQSGLALRARGDALGVPFELAGRVRPGRTPAALLAALQVQVQGATQPFPVDPEWLALLRPLDRGVADALDALQPQGQAQGQFALDWRAGAPPHWLGHLALEDMTSQFRGFLEEDGERPSFPYPVSALRGDLVVADRRVLSAVTGRLGEGALRAAVAVLLGTGPAGIAADVGIDDFVPDGRVTAAAAGTPAINEVVRILGGPQGGRVNARLSVRRSLGAQDAVVGLTAGGAGVELRPSFLPVPMLAEDFTVSWEPGHGRFAGAVRALGGSARLEGEIHELAGRARQPLLGARVDAEQLQPSAEERKVLEHFLQLPPGSAQIAAAGAAALHVDFRRAGAAPPEVQLQWECTDLAVHVQPLGLAAAGIRASGTAVRAGDDTLVALPRAAGTVAGAGVDASLVFAPGGARGATRALLAGTDIQPSREIVELLWKRARRADTAPLQPGGSMNVRLEFIPGEARLPWGVAELAPLRLRRSGAVESDEIEVNGRVRFDGLSASSPELGVRTRDGGMQLRDFQAQADEAGVIVSAHLHSDEGLVLGERFAALVSTDAWAALNRIGLRGRVGADGMRVDLELPRGGKPGFHAEGRMLLSEMSLEGPPRMRRGAGVLDVQSFDWSGPQDFGGSMQLRAGRVDVSGLMARDIAGDVHVNSGEIVFRDLSASALGGTVRTYGAGEDGAEERGAIHFGLTPEAPLAVLLHLEDLSLARVADELNVAAGVGGKLRGRVQFRSATPSPLDYVGRGHLEVTDGQLGSVPVLRTLWRVLDLNPPLFRSASLDFVFGGAANPGTVYVQRLFLEHPVLAVMAEGWIDLDGYLRMKATVRTFHSIPVLGFVLGLPVIRDLVDALVEQNFFGPIEDPVITQRALRGGGDDRRHPFPLWVPDIPEPDWERSPALPISGRNAGRSD
ncbi:MAG: hypothetical protein EYC70_00185 [Planctomycetota bacterium]|nr:MAG: hypothetical protein EYC70_00185 [Planctomycetota bacterium]